MNKISHSPYVICLNSNVVYSGVREAGRVTGCDNSNISKVCRGIRKSVNGLKFQYFNPAVHFGYKYYKLNNNKN